MGIFSKIKEIFKKGNQEENKVEEKEVEETVAVKLESPIKEPQLDVDRIVKEVKKEEKMEALSKLDKTKEEREALIKNAKVYEKGLSKTRNSFVSNLINLTNRYSKITEAYFDELEEILIMADIGVNTVMGFMDRLRARVKKEHLESPADLKEIIVDELFIIYVNDEVLVNKIQFAKEGPTVILMVGVNGVGKTTSIGKLASNFKADGKKVILAAADTFRAAAIDQLSEWAKRNEIEMIAQDEGSDPASVVYDAISACKNRDADILICDTAGRLHNKKNLMEELAKIRRIIDKEWPEAHKEILLVLDGTTGQNALNQAKEFMSACDVDGIILTKMDGTAKGGIAVAIASELSIPVKYIGVGEKIDDLQKFDPDDFVNALFDVKS